MSAWILLVLFYGLAKGVRDVIKKKALTKNTVMEVLFVYTLIAFLFCIPELPEAIKPMPNKYFFLIGFKSFVIFLAWILSFKAIDQIPISIYGVVDLSRIIFSTLFGIFVLHETITLNSSIGFVLVIFGLLFLKIYPTIKEKQASNNEGKSSSNYYKEYIQSKYIIMCLCSCLLNAVSGCLDKVYMADITASQLQFWYMFYLTLMYGLYFIITRIKINISVWKNIWIWLLSILFFLADKALFIANGHVDSKVTIMTLIKQSACIVSILAGKFVFKEKNIGYKLFCALIILIGIVISVI